MKTNLLRYRLSDPAGSSSRFFAIIIAIGGVALSLTLPLAGVALVVFGALPFFCFKCLEIDFYKGTYMVGVNIAGHTIGKHEPYPGVKCIFLKKNRTIESSIRYSWSSIVSTSFDGYLWLEDETKILLSASSKKEEALLKLQPLAQELKTELWDLTIQPPVLQVDQQ